MPEQIVVIQRIYDGIQVGQNGPKFGMDQWSKVVCGLADNFETFTLVDYELTPWLVRYDGDGLTFAKDDAFYVTFDSLKQSGL